MADLEDEIFEKKLAEKRHNELKTTLTKIASAISLNNNDDIVEAIGKQVLALNTFINNLSDSNDKEEVLVLNNVKDNINNVLLELKDIYNCLDKKKNWKFIINRDNNGFIESVDVNQK